VQRLLEYGRLERGSVNRALYSTTGFGGKGANTARMAMQLGGSPVLVGFAGGANGRWLEEMLTRARVDFRHVQVAGETRICQTLVEKDNPQTTELVEEMPPITPSEWRQMLALFALLDLSDAVVPISGKLPAGAPIDAYAQITKMVAEQGGRVVLDAPGEPLLLALEHGPFMVKINEFELLQTCGGEDVMAACRELLKRGAESVLITRGSRSAFFMSGSEVLEITPPEIVAVNPVGSGDAVMAGIAVELSRGKEISEAILTGIACGTANALNRASGHLNVSDVEQLLPRVRCAPFN